MVYDHILEEKVWREVLNHLMQSYTKFACCCHVLVKGYLFEKLAFGMEINS